MTEGDKFSNYAGRYPVPTMGYLGYKTKAQSFVTRTKTKNVYVSRFLGIVF